MWLSPSEVLNKKFIGIANPVIMPPVLASSCALEKYQRQRLLEDGESLHCIPES